MTDKKKDDRSAFDKRVKRRITGRPHTFFAACPPGLVNLCRNELASLPDRLAHLAPKAFQITRISRISGGVEFDARLDDACLAAFLSGIPVRMLMRIAQFKADSFFRLEQQLEKIDWELYLPPNCIPDIRVTARQSRLYHSDAVADRCRRVLTQCLNTSPPPVSDNHDNKAQTLMVRADNNRFELSLDMSGAPLFKRGIKQQVVQAPLRENLAHAILTRLEFSDKDVLVDPMCGSGTFCLEAAMIQAGLPPGFFRRFAFEAWPGFKEKAFTHARTKLAAEITTCSHPTLFASDLDEAAVDRLKKVCCIHPAFERISVLHHDFFDRVPPKTRSGVVVLNPPYGLRLGKDLDLDRFFREIGRKLATDFNGWRAGIIYPHPRLLKALDLNLSAMPLFHGGLDLHAAIGVIE